MVFNRPDSDAASLDARRKSRRRLLIMVISATILVAIVIAAIAIANRGSSQSSAAPDIPRLPTTIELACNKTRFPETCYRTLLQATRNISNVDPVTLFQISLEVAMEGLGKALDSLQALGTKQPLSKLSAGAWNDCQTLVQLAISQLNYTLTVEDITSADTIDDLRTWLSSVITLQDTCKDGFTNASTTLQAMVNGALKNSTEMSSNSLAILTNISKFLKSIKLNRKLLSDNTLEGGYPYWLNQNVRKLLNDSGSSPQPNMVVAQDGSGDYLTVTDAVAAVPKSSNEMTVIYVKSGTYKENVWVGIDLWNVMLIGDGIDKTIITFDLNFVDGVPTYSTATFGVLGQGFIAKDITFANTAGSAKQQAVAVMSASDKSVFYRVKFDAYQDTLYSHSNRQFFKDCVILGTIDFIFGNSASVYQGCTIMPRVPLLGAQVTITAQGKTDPNMNTGISIHNCEVVPEGSLDSVPVYLGRPWKPFSTTVFMKTALSNVINPAGWLAWATANETVGVPDTIFYGEFKNTGPGAATAGRVQWKGVNSKLDPTRASGFTVRSFIGGDSWLPSTGVPYVPGL